MIRWQSLRTRIFLYSILSTLIVGGTGILSQTVAQVFINDLSKIMQESEPYLGLQTNSMQLMMELEAYLDTRSHSALKNYWMVSEKLRTNISELPRPIALKKSAHLKLDLIALCNSYLKTSEDAIVAKRSRNPEALALVYSKADRLLSYINRVTGEIIQEDYLESTFQRSLYQDQVNQFRFSTVLVLLGVIGLGMLLGYWFAAQLTVPLERMALSADFMAKGDYSHSISTAKGPSELSLLAQAFETMRLSVESHINAERDRANFERGLMSERMENLRIKHLLEQAEFQALQAQINPHFLFNTLHTGIQLAIVEDADQTRAYIENLAAVFQHSLRSLDRPVLLIEELDSIKRYIAIMEIRFGDRFTFTLNLPESIPTITMPAMILQPLVENSINHGLKDCTENGHVEIGVTIQEDTILLWVSDNGVGIEPGMLVKICTDNPLELGDTDNRSSQSDGRKSNGIGLRNVLDRMSIFFGGQRNWTINSSTKQGTTIRFTIPWQGEDNV